jgi:hypothetical protein
MSNCETTKSTGVVFETYGDYRKHKFCQNIYKKNSKCDKNCFIEDCSDGTLTITTKNNGGGNINIDSKFISMDGSINIISQGEKGINFIDGSINTNMNDLIINSVNTFNTEISNILSIDCSNLKINSTDLNINTINTKILSDLLDISGISNINIKNDELNIDISNNSTITISDKSFRFEISGTDPSYIIMKDGSKNYILDDSNNTINACNIL